MLARLPQPVRRTRESPIRGWCNRQHGRFWPCCWRFESSPPSCRIVTSRPPAPSSSGPGRRPLKAEAAVRIRSGLPRRRARATCPGSFSCGFLSLGIDFRRFSAFFSTRAVRGTSCGGEWYRRAPRLGRKRAESRTNIALDRVHHGDLVSGSRSTHRRHRATFVFDEDARRSIRARTGLFARVAARKTCSAAHSANRRHRARTATRHVPDARMLACIRACASCTSCMSRAVGNSRRHEFVAHFDGI